ncbi:MAG TPA: hypothetical protein VHC47_01600 [Mucilaginibacter sp.]|nr:hypothetical protein [Mucilaginibacter sp.]
MKTILLCFLPLLSMASCSNETQGHDQISTSIHHKFENKIGFDTVRFFQDCKMMRKKHYIGGIQGTNAGRDSTGFIAFFPCYACHDTYEILFVHKGGLKQRKTLGYDGIEKDFLSGCNDSFSKFDCFAFVVPMRDPEKQSDMHALNMDFPTTVKVYERINGNKWEFIKEQHVKTFQEYGRLQLNVIYGKLD